MSSLTYNVFFWIFISYAVGQIVSDILVKKFKVKWFEGHNYISDVSTKWLGVLVFGWMIKNSFMGWFNKKLRLKPSADIDALRPLRKDMGHGESGHLVAFYFLLVVNIVFIFWGLEWWYIVTFFFMNVVFNLYLVFLQQYNKRRIDRIIEGWG